jgi:hypothetical protein
MPGRWAAQCAGHLLDAAGLLRDEPISFVLVGTATRSDRLASACADEGLTHVHLLPPIPKAQMPAFLAAVDIAYIGWQRVPIYRFGIAPNKLMDYMMAGCVVLHAWRPATTRWPKRAAA